MFLALPFSPKRVTITEQLRFAVIADEANSSQTGEAAAKLKTVLSLEEIEEFDDGGGISMDDNRSGILKVLAMPTNVQSNAPLFPRCTD